MGPQGLPPAVANTYRRDEHGLRLVNVKHLLMQMRCDDVHVGERRMRTVMMIMEEPSGVRLRAAGISAAAQA
jgi:hypothetical protein